MKILKRQRAELAKEGKTLPPYEFRRFRILSGKAKEREKGRKNSWTEGRDNPW